MGDTLHSRNGWQTSGDDKKQLVEPSDILVGVFWTRIGTDTGVSESGTIEKIEDFRKANKPVLLYFSSKPIPQDADLTQYQRVRAFKDKIISERWGLIDSFSSTSDLQDKLDRHLTTLVREPKSRNISNTSEVASKGPKEEVAEIKKQLLGYLDTYNADWAAEKISKPLSIDGGKRILRRFGDGLLRFRSQLYGLANDMSLLRLDALLTKTRTIQKYDVYIDGGVSYKNFWREGDEILKQAKFDIDLVQ